MSRQRPPRRAAKGGLHPRNRHRERYDFALLIDALPELAPHVVVNRHGHSSIDFADPQAVKSLNRALLAQGYGIEHWDIPSGYLCPPIPGRADYIHHLADLLASVNGGIIPRGKGVRGLDIGVGANCIYPIVGCCEYGWSFTATDINPVAVDAARLIVTSNPRLDKKIECRLQSSSSAIFTGVVKAQERFDFTLCNPPFHASPEAASAGTRQKLRNLQAGRSRSRAPTSHGAPPLNFGGQQQELWCEGGEVGFIRRMIEQSTDYGGQCYWFTTLVSKQENLAAIYRALAGVAAPQVRTVAMAQGQKISRFVGWSFLTAEQQQQWRQTRWER